MDMKPIYTTKFFEDCDDCCVCAVIFEDGKAVNIIDDLEKKGITGTKALEEARTGWQYAAPFVPDIVWKQTAEEKANELAEGFWTDTSLIAETDPTGKCHFHWENMMASGFEFFKDADEPEAIAYRIRETFRKTNFLDLTDCHRLCQLAGMEDAYVSAESKESALREAANKLGVTIWRLPADESVEYTTKFYEINTGCYSDFVFAAVFRAGIAVNVINVTPNCYRVEVFGTEAVTAARKGWPDATPFDPGSWFGYTIAQEIDLLDHFSTEHPYKLIAEIDSAGKYNLFWNNMGNSGLYTFQAEDTLEAVTYRLQTGGLRYHLDNGRRFCAFAGMEKEFDSANPENIEDVVKAAAIKLGIDK